MTQLTFHELTIRRRGDDYMVSADKEARHLRISTEAHAILKALQQHHITAVEEQYPNHDVQGFIKQLKDAGLVYKQGHRVVSEHRTLKQLADTPRNLTWANTNLFESVLLGLAIAALLLLLAIPSLAPKPHWLLPTTSLAATIPLAFIAWWLITLWHETGHYVLIGRTGAPTKLKLVHKWHLLLPLADTRAARTLNKQQRVLAHLGGILFTLALITILDLLLLYGILPTATRFLLVIAFLDLLIQLTPLPKTDLTGAFEHATGTANLPRKLLRTICPFCKEPPTEAVKRFMPAAVIGIVLLTAVLLAYLLPWLHYLITASLMRIWHGAITTQATLFWDGAATIITLGIALSLYAVTTLRQHKATETPITATLATLGFLAGNFTVVFTIAAAALLYLSPLATTISLYLVGLVYGGLFLGLLEAIDIEGAGFAKDFFLPAAAASTAIILFVVTTWYSVATGTPHPDAIHAIAYGAGMLSAIAV